MRMDTTANTHKASPAARPCRWFVSRHAGAIAWARSQSLDVDRWVAHLSIEQINAGDTVMGTLPTLLAAAVCRKRAHYWHLALELSAELRGRELSSAQLTALDARLVPMHITLLDEAL